MSQYNTGTIAITNGSAAVVGTSTLWAAEAAAGDWLMVLGDGLVYEILSVTDDTNLTLTNTFQRSTAATASYVITRDFTPNYGFALMGRADQETAAIYTRAITDIDSALTSYTVGAAALEAQHWANNPEGTLVEEGDLVDDYSSLHWSIKAEYWATTTGALVESLDYSAKEYSIGTFVPAGSSKQWASEVEDTIVASGLYSSLHYSAKASDSADLAEDWATLTGAQVAATDYSAKEFAIGTVVGAGSSRQWAVEVEDTIVTSGLYSALHYSAKATISAAAALVSEDNAEDWASLTGALVEATDYSAKEFAVGTFVPAGSSKQWATEVEDTIVASGLYSSLHYAAKAAASKTAAETAETNAETAETNAAATYDLFDDRMLGSKATDPTLDNDSNALVEGTLYWNSTNKVLRIYDGAAWQDTGSSTANITEWTATAGQTTFTGTDDNALALAYTAGYLMVFRNGTLLDPDDYTATTGSSVVLDTGADLNDTLNFIGFGTFDVANTYTKAEADNTFAPIARSNRNLIINGNFSIAQRNTSSVPMGNGTFLLDRWKYGFSGGVMVSSHAQIINNGAPEGQSAYYRMDVTTADTSIAVGDQSHLQQLIEGYNIIPLGWHLAAQGSKKPLTISFWTAHTKTGISVVSIRNGDTSRSYVAEYTQAVTGVWEKHTVTVPAPTDGTWAVDNTSGISLAFTQVSGSTYQTTKDTWATGNYISTSNQVNHFDNTANFFRLAGVQVEVGSAATDFEVRPFSEELAMCQRYYQKSYNYATAPADGADSKWYSGYVVGATQIRTTFSYPVVMSKDPILTFYRSSTGSAAGKWSYWNASTVDSTATTAISASDEVSLTLELTVTGRTLGDAFGVVGGWTALAEL